MPTIKLCLVALFSNRLTFVKANELFLYYFHFILVWPSSLPVYRICVSSPSVCSSAAMSREGSEPALVYIFPTTCNFNSYTNIYYIDKVNENVGALHFLKKKRVTWLNLVNPMRIKRRQPHFSTHSVFGGSLQLGPCKPRSPCFPFQDFLGRSTFFLPHDVDITFSLLLWVYRRAL